MATKKCIDCKKEIGETEVVCPACGCDFDTVELTIAEMDRADRIRAERKAEKDKLNPPPPPEPEKKKLGIFAGLAIKKAGKK